MNQAYAAGGNYTIDIDDGIVVVRVWKTPEVDSETGAAYAKETLTHVVKLASDPSTHALLLDLTDAPPITGPKTQGALEAMVGAFEARGKSVALVHGESRLQQMQLNRLLREAAPQRGRLSSSREDALTVLRTARSVR